MSSPCCARSVPDQHGSMHRDESACKWWLSSGGGGAGKIARFKGDYASVEEGAIYGVFMQHRAIVQVIGQWPIGFDGVSASRRQVVKDLRTRRVGAGESAYGYRTTKNTEGENWEISEPRSGAGIKRAGLIAVWPAAGAVAACWVVHCAAANLAYPALSRSMDRSAAGMR